MNKKFYKVSKDIPESLLIQLWHEGRLWASSSSEELAISEAIQKLRDIRSVVSPEYERNIEKTMQAIFSIPTIKARMLYKKGKVAGTTNYATIVIILKYLQGRYVFQCSFNELLRMVFGNTKYNKNTNKKCYSLSYEEEMRIKSILSNFSSMRDKP